MNWQRQPTEVCDTLAYKLAEQLPFGTRSEGDSCPSVLDVCLSRGWALLCPSDALLLLGFVQRRPRCERSRGSTEFDASVIDWSAWLQRALLVPDGKRKGIYRQLVPLSTEASTSHAGTAVKAVLELCTATYGSGGTESARSCGSPQARDASDRAVYVEWLVSNSQTELPTASTDGGTTTVDGSGDWGSVAVHRCHLAATSVHLSCGSERATGVAIGSVAPHVTRRRRRIAEVFVVETLPSWVLQSTSPRDAGCVSPEVSARSAQPLPSILYHPLHRDTSDACKKFVAAHQLILPPASRRKVYASSARSGDDTNRSGSVEDLFSYAVLHWPRSECCALCAKLLASIWPFSAADDSKCATTATATVTRGRGTDCEKWLRSALDSGGAVVHGTLVRDAKVAVERVWEATLRSQPVLAEILVAACWAQAETLDRRIDSCRWRCTRDGLRPQRVGVVPALAFVSLTPLIRLLDEMSLVVDSNQGEVEANGVQLPRRVLQLEQLWRDAVSNAVEIIQHSRVGSGDARNANPCGADDLVPILVFALLSCATEHLYGNLLVMQQLRRLRNHVDSDVRCAIGRIARSLLTEGDATMSECKEREEDESYDDEDYHLVTYEVCVSFIASSFLDQP